MNENETIFMSGDGVIADISGVQKPARLIPIIKRCQQYIDAMGYAKKQVDAITLYSGDYSDLFKQMNKAAKEQSRPPVVGLKFHDVPVRSAHS